MARLNNAVQASDDIARFAEQSDSTSGIDRYSSSRLVPALDLHALPAGTFVTVDTLNTRYRLTMRDDIGRTALIQGGKLFPDETLARVEGATLGGAEIRMGWIQVGLSLELSVGSERVVTSRVRAISVNGATL